MKEFMDINTGLPYRESESTVDAIVEKCTENARRHSLGGWRAGRPLIYSLAGVAAAAAIVLAMVIPSGRQAANSPIDSFLASITDAEAAMIVDLTIDDIPEYY